MGAWNDMMGQFLTELVTTFPEEPAIKKYKTSFELIRKTNPRLAIEGFMRAIRECQDQIMQKDESFFLSTSDQNEFQAELNIAKHWNDSLSSNTKDAIWQYLQTLSILGTTLTALPADALSQIENVAESMAKNIQDGNGINESALTGLFASLAGMLGGEKK
jgi:hypothetical protein